MFLENKDLRTSTKEQGPRKNYLDILSHSFLLNYHQRLKVDRQERMFWK